MKIGKSLTELAAEIERQAKSKKDYVASLDAIEMKVVEKAGGLVPVVEIENRGEFGIREIAHGQIAEHTKIPKIYYDRMRSQAPELLVNNVNEWFRKYPAPQMIRTLDHQMRALLSAGYKPLDNYDFFAAIFPILAERKLNVMSCEVTERKLYVKAVDEQLFRDVPVGYKMGDGSNRIFETCAPAVIFSNSEVGFGRLSVETGVYTRACTNLALMAKGGMRRTHVGVRNTLAEGVQVDDLDSIIKTDTRRKTDEAIWLQTRDVIAAAFDEKVVTKRVEAYEVAAGRRIEGKVEKVMEVAAEQFGLSMTEKESIFKHLIEGGSLTQYGLHAAITRAAQDVESYDRATELEYLGGRVVELPRTEWQVLAEAA
jgi:hypothetical protein